MRNFIKQILKEETQHDFIQKVIQHLKTDILGNISWPTKKDIIFNYGLQQNDIDYLHKVEEEAINRIKGVLFNVLDFRLNVGIGGYDFKFLVRDLLYEEHDVEKYTEIQWILDSVVFLSGATVELIVHDEAIGEGTQLETAIDNPDYGWEIESEIGDLMADIIYSEEPILRALGAEISIDKSYE